MAKSLHIWLIMFLNDILNRELELNGKQEHLVVTVVLSESLYCLIVHENVHIPNRKGPTIWYVKDLRPASTTILILI